MPPNATKSTTRRKSVSYGKSKRSNDCYKMETCEANSAPFVDKITTSSCIPGYDYKKGSAAHFWHSHMIGQEWMRIDFIKPTRITGFQIQGTGQPGGRYWVENFHIKVVTPSGDLVPFQNNKSFAANNDANTTKPVKLMDAISCKGIMIFPEVCKNDTIAMKLWVTRMKA